MSQTISKVCVVCGQNVANKPRTKDQAGRYYCNPCYQSLAEQRRPPSPSPPIPLVNETPPEVAVPEVTSSEQYACGLCGQSFDVENVYADADDETLIICKDCYAAKTAAPQRSAAPPTPAQKKPSGCATAIGVASTVVILLIFIANVASSVSLPSFDVPPVVWGIGAVVIAVFAIVIFVAMQDSRCPSCRRYRAALQIASEVVDRRLEVDTDPTTGRQKFYNVTVINCLNQCQYCGHQWVSQDKQRSAHSS